MSEYIRSNLREADCPICGKHFIPAAKNIYKIKMRVNGRNYHKIMDCCSYKCYRAYHKLIEDKEQQKILNRRKKQMRKNAGGEKNADSQTAID